MCTPASPVMIGSWCSVDSLAQPPDVTFGAEPSSDRVNSGIALTSLASWYATVAPGASCCDCRPNPPSPGLPWSGASAEAAVLRATSPPMPNAAVLKNLRLLLSILVAPCS